MTADAYDFALLPKTELAQLRAELVTAQATAARWRDRCLEQRELVLLVEAFADTRDAATAQALIDAFCAFRNLIEGGVPLQWLVAPATDAAPAMDDVACPF